MRKNFQNVTLKQWHRALLRLTLPIVWVFLLICLCFTLALLGVPCIIVIIAINVIIYTFVESVLSGNKYDFTTEYYKELELKFSGTKSDLVDEVQNYIDSIAPYSNLRAFELVENCEKYNIDICAGSRRS